MGEKLKKMIGVQGDFKTTILPMINYSYANMYLGGAGYIISMYFTVFLTDVVNISLQQAGVVVMLATVNGTSVVTEGVWDSRFQYVEELLKMNKKLNRIKKPKKN